MIITKVSFEQLNLPLNSPYTIAYDTIDSVTNFILRLETDTKIVGFGCAAFDEILSGQSTHSISEITKNVVQSFSARKQSVSHKQNTRRIKTFV